MNRITIVQDSREKHGHHDNVLQGLHERGINVVRSKLYVGDYAKIYDMSVVIDVKQDLQEVYGNLIGQQHRRFTDECKRAQGNDIRLIILVEQAGIKSIEDVKDWVNPREERYFRILEGKKFGKYRNVKLPEKPPVSSEQLMRTMKTVAERYGCEWMFCDKWETVNVMLEVFGIGRNYQSAI